jgi:hypothetical protein
MPAITALAPSIEDETHEEEKDAVEHVLGTVVVILTYIHTYYIYTYTVYIYI